MLTKVMFQYKISGLMATFSNTTKDLKNRLLLGIGINGINYKTK